MSSLVFIGAEAAEANLSKMRSYAASRFVGRYLEILNGLPNSFPSRSRWVRPNRSFILSSSPSGSFQTGLSLSGRPNQSLRGPLSPSLYFSTQSRSYQRGSWSTAVQFGTESEVESQLKSVSDFSPYVKYFYPSLVKNLAGALRSPNEIVLSFSIALRHLLSQITIEDSREAKLLYLTAIIQMNQLLPVYVSAICPGNPVEAHAVIEQMKKIGLTGRTELGYDPI